jgi:hypothetical protein
MASLIARLDFIHSFANSNPYIIWNKLITGEICHLEVVGSITRILSLTTSGILNEDILFHQSEVLNKDIRFHQSELVQIIQLTCPSVRIILPKFLNYIPIINCNDVKVPKSIDFRYHETPFYPIFINTCNELCKQQQYMLNLIFFK